MVNNLTALEMLIFEHIKNTRRLIETKERRSTFEKGGRDGLDRIVVGFLTTYAISAYHH